MPSSKSFSIARCAAMSLPEALRDEFLWQAPSIVIAGTHGKTTTTSLAGWLLTHGGKDPTVFVGGIARNFGSSGSSYRIGAPTAPFVIEGDEYDSAFFDKTAKFLKYLPDIAVINNIEFDHADIYPDLDAVRLAFRRLVNLVPRRGLTLIGADSPDAAALAQRALQPRADIRRRRRARLARDGDRAARRSGRRSGCGTRGATAGCSPCRWRACTTSRTRSARSRSPTNAASRSTSRAKGLAAFLGVKRRLEVVGTQPRRRRVRRLRASSDGGCGNPGGAPCGAAAGADLGRVRAALGLVLPPHFPGRLRSCLRDGPIRW